MKTATKQISLSLNNADCFFIHSECFVGLGYCIGLLPSLNLHSNSYSHSCHGLGREVVDQILGPEVMLRIVLFTFHQPEHFLCHMAISKFKEALRDNSHVYLERGGQISVSKTRSIIGIDRFLGNYQSGLELFIAISSLSFWKTTHQSLSWEC